MMKKGEKNQGGLKVHDFFHGGYSKMYFKPAEESFFSGEGNGRWLSRPDACEIHLQIHGFRFPLQGGGVSDTMKIDAFPFCSAEEAAMALVDG